MKFTYEPLENCENAKGLVVVIDVLRAFSATAYAFYLGSKKIFLVSSIDEAFFLKKQLSGAKLMGEDKGLPIAGFDYGNSPTELMQLVAIPSQIIQRTSKGTQGVVRCISADIRLASSFCCAISTAAFIKQQSRRKLVSFIITGQNMNDDGDEDLACANYIEDLVKDKSSCVEKYLQRVRKSKAAQKYYDLNRPAFPLSDLNYCLAVNKFDFIMYAKTHIRLSKKNVVLIKKPVIRYPNKKMLDILHNCT